MTGRRIVPLVGLVLLVVQLGCRKPDTPAPTEPVARPSDIGPGWKRVDAGAAFSFWVPEELQQQRATGTDSYVGEYLSSKMRIRFDYGRYSNPLTGYSARPGCDEENESISGREARIVQCQVAKADSKYGYFAAIHFADVHEAGEDGETMKLTMEAEFKQEGDLETARKIFESIAFK